MSEENLVGSAYVKIMPNMAGFAEGLLGGAEPGLASLKHLAAGAFAGAVVEFGAKAVEMASTFDQQMTMLTTEAQVPRKAVQALTGDVLALAAKVGTSPDSLAEALYHVESAFQSTGITNGQAIDLVKTAAEGAKIGQANLVDVTNALDAAVVSGIPGVQNYQQAMGDLLGTVGSGDMQMQDLADAFGTGMVSAVKQYGLSLTDVGAALAVFGDNNIRGQVAATDLRMSVQDLAGPTKVGQKMLQDMGMSAGQLTGDIKTGGLLKALDDLKGHLTQAGVTGSSVGPVLQEMFTKKAGVGLSIMLDQLDRLHSKYGDITKASQGFGDAWAAQQQTFKQHMDDLKAGLDSFMIKVGNKLIPILLEVGDKLGKAWDAALPTIKEVLSGLSQGFKAFTEGWDGQKLTGNLSPIMKLVHDVAGALREFFDWLNKNHAALAVFAITIGSIVAPFWTLAAALIYAYNHFAPFREVVQAIASFVDAHLKPILIALGITFAAIAGPVALVGALALVVMANWKNITKYFEGVWADITSTFSGAWQRISTDVSNWWDDTVAIFDEVVDTLEHVFSRPLGVLKALFKTCWDEVSHLTRIAFSALEMFFKVDWAIIVAIFKIAWATLTAAWHIFWDIFGAAFKAAWDLAVAIFKAAWDMIAAVFKMTWGIIRGILGLFISIFTGQWGQAWNAVKLIFTSIWDFIVTAFKSSLHIIVVAFTGFWNVLVTIFETLKTNVSAWATKVWGTLVDALTTAASAIWKFFTNLPSQLWSLVTSVAGDLVNLGSQIVTWIVQGIESIGGDIAKSLLDQIPGGSEVAGWLGLGGSSKKKPAPGANLHGVAPGAGAVSATTSINNSTVVNGVDTNNADRVGAAAARSTTAALTAASRQGAGNAIGP